MSIKNCENDWLSYFYVDNEGNSTGSYLRTNSLEEFGTRIIPYEHEPDNNIWDSCLETAKRLHHDYREIVIGYSGGIDSEIAVLAYCHLKLPFKVLIIEWYWGEKLVNGHDICYAKKLCNELNLNPIIRKKDLKKLYLTDEWKRIASTYQAVSPCQHALLYTMEDFEYPWMQVDEIETGIEFKNNDAFWAFTKKEDQDGCWRKFNQITKIPALNNFYTYRLENVHTWFKNPTIRELVNNKIYGKLGMISSKHQVFSQCVPYQIEKRPKLYGLEDFQNLWYNNIVNTLPSPEIRTSCNIRCSDIISIITSRYEHTTIQYKENNPPLFF